MAGGKGKKNNEDDETEDSSGGGNGNPNIDPTASAYSSGHPVFNDDLEGPPFGPPGPDGGATLGGLGQGNGPQGVANAARENILEIINKLPPPAQANLEDLLDQGSPVPGEDPPVEPPEANRIGLFDGPAGAAGNELWAYDGTTAFRVVGPDGTSVIENPTNFFEFGGDIYFSGDTDATGRELYKIDGATGAITLFDINTDASNSNPSNFFVFDGDLYFSAFDPVNGTELR
ncbi:MAG: hypothetical protein GY791_13320 [Alphaproteobacteria bacterium]|nr:hypothetical protein [Alphaproteobacteria bacterium]